MNKNLKLIIDFDSTFIQTETLDELARISLEGTENREEILSKIETLTNLGMEGKIAFSESLEKRLELFAVTKEKIDVVILFLKNTITPSFVRNKKFIEEMADQIYIISGGFKEIITPIAGEYGIKPDHILANEFIFDQNGKCLGVDKNNFLSQKNGKIKEVENLKLSGDIYVIGDGMTDYKVKEAGQATKFFAFIENIERQAVVEKADFIVKNLDEALAFLKLPRTQYFPKSKMKVLLLENINTTAIEIFQKQGFEVETYPKALEESELIKKIKDVSVIGIRSRTIITTKVLENANKLLAIGIFGVGTNPVNPEECAQKGISVFNSPYASTRSVVELAIMNILALFRRTFEKSMIIHNGMWNKSVENCYEIRGKKLGILGYGNIGSQLSIIAENLGMDVYYYDLEEKLGLGNSKKCNSMEELLNIVDIVSIHVDGRESNRMLIGKKEFDLMKNGSYIVNTSRGYVVDIDELVKNLKSGKLQGAAINVFPKEPQQKIEEFISPLQGLSNVILTSHHGGNTIEAQQKIGIFTAEQLIKYINTGSTNLSVNFPEINLAPQENVHRLIHIYHNVPGVLAKINEILGIHHINILGQYLKTNESIGYVITDVNKVYNQEVYNKLKKVEGTIKVRILY